MPCQEKEASREVSGFSPDLVLGLTLGKFLTSILHLFWEGASFFPALECEWEKPRRMFPPFPATLAERGMAAEPRNFLPLSEHQEL